MTQTRLTTREVAAALGVSPRTVARMAQDGRLKPATTVPRYRGDLLFDPAEVERYAAERKAHAA